MRLPAALPQQLSSRLDDLLIRLENLYRIQSGAVALQRIRKSNYRIQTDEQFSSSPLAIGFSSDRLAKDRLLPENRRKFFLANIQGVQRANQRASSPGYQ